MALRIRRFERDDRAAVDDVVEAALRSADAYFEDAPALTDGDILSEYVDVGGEFLVGEVAGEIIATAAFRPPKGIVADLVDVDEAVAEVKRMHVHPDHHRRGFGRAMYEELESRARDRGFERLALSTSERQEPAHAFYAEHGFDHVATTTVDVDGVSLDILVFEKAL